MKNCGQKTNLFLTRRFEGNLSVSRRVSQFRPARETRKNKPISGVMLPPSKRKRVGSSPTGRIKRIALLSSLSLPLLRIAVSNGKGTIPAIQCPEKRIQCPEMAQFCAPAGLLRRLAYCGRLGWAAGIAAKAWLRLGIAWPWQNNKPNTLPK